jgi:hypothetical protein
MVFFAHRGVESVESAAMRILHTFCEQQPDEVMLTALGLFPAMDPLDPAWHERISLTDVFHVSQLKKWEQVLEAQIIEETNAEIKPDLSLAEYPMRVLDHKERQTRRQKVRMYKIQWSHHTEEEATWETEQFLNTKYPDFLPSQARK